MADIITDLQRGVTGINAIETKLKAKGVIGEQEEVAIEDFPDKIDAITPNLQDKEVNVSENGTIEVSCDSGYDGLGTVTIVTLVE